MKFLKANRIAMDGKLCFGENAMSHLGLFRNVTSGAVLFPMSHKKDVRLIWVKL